MKQVYTMMHGQKNVKLHNYLFILDISEFMHIFSHNLIDISDMYPNAVSFKSVSTNLFKRLDF